MTTQSPPLLCEVFRSPRRAGTYLFVDRQEGMQRVPQALLDGFGTPQSVLTLKLHPQRKLAQAEAATVLAAIRDRGYYLQLPPSAATPGDAEGGARC